MRSAAVNLILVYMTDTGTERTASPHAPGPGVDQLSETQISVEIVPKSALPASDSFSLQALVRDPADLDPRPSQAQKKLNFNSESAPDSGRFKITPICYHVRRRTPVLAEVQLHSSNLNRGIIKQTAPQRRKTVSFSMTHKAENAENKENQSPEDIDLKDSLELTPQVPKETVNTKASGRAEGEALSTTVGTGVDEEPEPKCEVSYDEKVRCNRVSSVEPRILPKNTEKPALIYCPACNRDMRTMVRFESVQLRTLQQLVCCWQETSRQVMAVHKCVSCKRVVARILQ